MPRVTKDLESFAIKSGVSYFFDVNNQALALNESINVHIKTGDKEMFLTSIIADANAEQIDWEVYSNPVVQDGTGIAIDIKNRLPTSQSSSGASIIQDPTVTADGDAIFPAPRIILGQDAQGSTSSFIYRQLLTGGFILPANAEFLMRYTNRGLTASCSVFTSMRDNI